MKHAFSLVELSIVLVILGLLTGGILAGQSLIRAAEIRGTTTQMAQYRAAMYSFRDKYFAFPGDITNATSFWTSAGGTGSDWTCISAQSAGSNATCNGNGNGQIDGTAPAVHSERFAAWKHLANAGLVEGSYTGKTTGTVSSYDVAIGTNLPPAKAGKSFVDIGFVFPNTAIWFSASSISRNALGLYGASSSGSSNPGAIRPEEAWNVDTKLDDGSPVTGAVFSTKRSSVYGPNCTTSDADTATYDFSTTATNCIFFIGL